MSDPFQIVWDELDGRGYGPRGRLHDFRSRCPGHQGDNVTSLHAWDRGDGAVWLHCFAHGCSAEEIVEPLGLRVRDLFPVDPGDSGRRVRTARREDFTGNAKTAVNVLKALEDLGERWSLAIWPNECPNCEWPWAQLSISATGDPRFYCPRGCDVRMLNQALAERLDNRRRSR